ncbi:MAG: translation initiation factor IF-3 [Actinobacteria bacterium]|nr:translation initiation factor IF-3 [Actinomycetota bacterium]
MHGLETAGFPVRRFSRPAKPAATTTCAASGGRDKGDTEEGAVIAVDDARFNEQIRAREVRLISETGEQLGVTPTSEALDYARSKDLDLVEVAPGAAPPVARVMDFKKYLYDQQQRRKEARKKQTHVSIKEMKFRPKIDRHDYATKVRHVERFLHEGSKVKLTIMFRGREVSHPELGKRILDRVAEEVEDFAEVEHYPRIDGRNMTMVLAPVKDGRRRRRVSVPEEAPVTAAAATENDEPALDGQGGGDAATEAGGDAETEASVTAEDTTEPTPAQDATEEASPADEDPAG